MLDHLIPRMEPTVQLTFSCNWFDLFLLQLEGWLEELRQENCDEAPETLEAAERQLEECARQRDSCLDACVSTIGHGETLLQELR